MRRTILVQMPNLLIGALVLVALLMPIAFWPRQSAAFSGGSFAPVHAWITDRGFSDARPGMGNNFGNRFIRSAILDRIKEGNRAQDAVGANNADDRRHFMGCMFQDASTYINWEYGEVIKALAKQPPDTSQAAYCFGHLVHTAQDFYAHSNWVEIWRKRGAYRCDNDTNTSSDISLTDYRLYEPGLGKWCNPTIFGGDWHASLDWSLYPYYQGRNATNYNNIIIAQTHLGGYDYIPTGWTATPGTPPNEKVPTIVADRNGDGTPERYDVLITAGSGPKCEYTSPGPVRIQFCRDRRSYNAIAIEHDNRLGKDNSDIANYEDAYWNAVFQTRHEWWRLLNLLREEGARQNRGFDLASAVLGGWLDPAVRYTERKSGSIHVTISSSVSRNGSRLTAYNFLLYRGDFSDYENANGAGPLTLRVAKDDTIVMTVQPEGLTGASLSMKASDVTPGDYPAISRDVQATFHVSVVSAGPATVRHN